MTQQTPTNNKPIGLESQCWDNFALSCHRNCPTYYYYRIERGVVKPGISKTAADFGAAIHSALEYWYGNGMTQEAAVKAVEVFIQEFAPHQSDTDDKRTSGKGIEILLKYFDKYRNEPFNVIKPELGGVVELGPYLYSFRIDLIVEWQSPRGVFGFDHKTTSSLNRMLAKPNNQFTGYIYALSQYYDNLLGYILNAIGVYKTSTSVNKATGRKEEREILKRLPTSRTRRELDDWVKRTISRIEDIHRDSERGFDTIDHHAAEFCQAYNGLCPYLELCQAQDPFQILDALLQAGVYTIDRWAPFQVADGTEEEVS